MTEKTRKKKVDEITIKMVGSKKFKQGIVDRIFEFLMSDEVQSPKPGDGLNFETTIAPSDEVM